MKSCLIFFISIFFFNFFVFAQDPEVPLADVELNWEAVEDAKHYELEFTLKAAGAEPKKYSVEGTEFTEKMPAGKYKFRMRTHSQNEGPGEWSKAMTVAVLPLDVVLYEPEDGGVVQPLGKKKKHLVYFRWQAVKDAKYYTLRVWSAKMKPFEVTTKKDHRKLSLPVGKEYKWEVRAEGRHGVKYERHNQEFTFLLMGKKLKTPNLTNKTFDQIKQLEWAPVKGAKTYHGSIYRKDIMGENWVLFKEDKEVSGAAWKLDKTLPPGEYRISLTAQSPKAVDSDPQKKEFLIKPKFDELSVIRMPASKK